MSEWKHLYSEVADLEPPVRLASRISAMAAAAETAPQRSRRAVVGRGLGVAALGVTIAAVLGLLILAAHSHRGHQVGGAKPAPSIVSSGGVRVAIPVGWTQVKPASDAPVVDPRTLLVVGTHGVEVQRSQCEITKYHVPARGAVVVVIGWLSSKAGGGPVGLGRAALSTTLKAVHPSAFECSDLRGAAVEVRLGGRDYQVNVMVGDQASSERIDQALVVARSFNLVVPPTRVNCFVPAPAPAPAEFGCPGSAFVKGTVKSSDPSHPLPNRLDLGIKMAQLSGSRREKCTLDQCGISAGSLSIGEGFATGRWLFVPQAVPGFRRPPPIRVTLKAGETTTLTIIYEPRS
jgi:hypothetical protein